MVQRKSNIEFLRIVLMLMIIIHHILYHGLGLKNVGQNNLKLHNSIYGKVLLDSFAIVAVNTFVFISGYFGITFKLRTVVAFVLQALFYSISFCLIFSLFNRSLWSTQFFLNSFIPISKSLWWFISIYLGLYFISPFLNKGVETISRYYFTIILVGLLYFDCFSGFLFGTFSESGYSIFNFIVIYLVGRYIKQYRIEVRNPLLLYCFFTMLLFSGTIFLIHQNKLANPFKLFSYNDPILIASSIMLFFVFKKFDIKYNKAINLIAAQVMGVYFIHDYPLVRDCISDYIKYLKISYQNNLIVFIFFTVLVVLVVFMGCIVIEYSRKYFFDKIVNRLVLILNTNKIVINYKQKLLNDAVSY